MNKDEVFIGTMVILLVFGTFAVGFSMAQPASAISGDIIYSGTPDFMLIIKNISESHEHSVEYNCQNFSQDLVEALEDSGYSARVVYGWASLGEYCETPMNGGKVHSTDIVNTSCGQPHAWVEMNLTIDAVTGQIVR